MKKFHSNAHRTQVWSNRRKLAELAGRDTAKTPCTAGEALDMRGRMR